jgi:putative transposase
VPLRASSGAAIAPAAARQQGAASIGGNIRKITLSQVFAGQMVGLKQVDERIWLVSFVHYDLGYFDDETWKLEPVANPFGPKVLPMSSE